MASRDTTDRAGGARRLRRRAYTLIEIIAALTVFTIAVAAVVATAAAGLRVYRRARNYNLQQADAILALERIERDLRNVFILDTIPFTGSDRMVTFPGIVSTPGLGGELQSGPGDLSYYRDDVRNELVVRRRAYAAATRGTEYDGEVTVLAHAVEAVSFAYLHYDGDTQQYTWRDTWAAADGIPAGVRVQVQTEGDNPLAQYTRTVFLPVATPALR